MKEREFFRVEKDDTKKGPYNCGGGPNLSHHCTKRWPSPNVDAGLSKFIRLPWTEREKYVFGFESMEQLTTWFSKELRLELFELGFVVRKYKSRQYFVSSKQAVFIKYEKVD